MDIAHRPHWSQRLRALAAIAALLLPGLAPRAEEAEAAPAQHVESPYFAVQGDSGID